MISNLSEHIDKKLRIIRFYCAHVTLRFRITLSIEHRFKLRILQLPNSDVACPSIMVYCRLGTILSKNATHPGP